jgi:hypothetical protein
MPEFLEVQKRAEEYRAQYAARANRDKVNILLYGDFGTGKTRLAVTCPKPVFLDSFDPGGTTTRELQPFIKSGDILIDDRWEGDSWKKPYAFEKWEKEMEERIKMDFFSHIGTYMVDSLTKLADSCMFRILQKGGKEGSRTGKPPELQDYLVQQLTVVDWLGRVMALPCHTIVTGHIAKEQDGVTGAFETGLLLWGKLVEKVPLVFDEKWITRVKDKKYTLQTHTEGIYKAETRIGGDQFNTFEEPDFKALLKKAGLPAEDKPSLFSKE